MRYQVHLTRKAKKQLDRLGRKIRDRIDTALKNLISHYDGEEIHPPDIKMLKGKYEGLLRLRIGDMRVIFKMEQDEFVILIIDIVSRGDAYKK